MTGRRTRVGAWGWALVVCAAMAGTARAQQNPPGTTAAHPPGTTAGPATDAAANASPIKPAPKVPADDAAANASPVTPMPGGGPSLAPGTAIPIQLMSAVDSGQLKNGQTVSARLRAAVKSQAVTLPAGTPVTLTVVGTVPAGELGAAGELSLQVLRVGKVSVFTDTQTFHGKPGHKDLPDSAPAVGTDASLASGAVLTFHVQPPPAPAP